MSWVSELQSTVALSTAEAETIVGVKAVKEVVYLRYFSSELEQDRSKMFDVSTLLKSLLHMEGSNPNGPSLSNSSWPTCSERSTT